MKLVSLETRKKILKYTRQLGTGMLGVIMLSGAGLGIAANVFLQHRNAGGAAETAERAEVQGKIDHLIVTYNEMQALDVLVKTPNGPQAVGTSAAAIKTSAANLHQQFNSEEEATGIAIAHATKVSPSDLDDMVQPLKVIKPLPDYFLGPSGGNGDFETIHFAQGRVMKRPGFTPTLASAREIAVIAKDTRMAGGMLFMLGPMLLTLGAGCAFNAARKRLACSIETEEQETRQREEAAKKLAAERRKMARAAALAEVAARPAKVAASMKEGLGQDIQIKKIKLLTPRKAGLS